MSDVFSSNSLGSGELLLEARGIQKIYSQEGSRLEILRGIDLELKEGEAVSIVGASGAGKSTLLHILGALDRPTLGRVMYRGQDVFAMSDEALAQFRNRSIGFVFQFHHLLAEFTALENVSLPCRIAGESRKEAMLQAREMLDRMGLEDRAHHYPTELSGGERQRVAIARALVKKPEILLADEPTGNLDTHTAERIQDLFFELQRAFRLTLLVVTHDISFAQRFPRVLHMRDGLWASDRLRRPESTRV